MPTLNLSGGLYIVAGLLALALLREAALAAASRRVKPLAEA